MGKSFFWDRRLFLIRHGQAEGNRHGVFLGRRDDPLTEEGRRQASHLAGLLADEPIARVYTSPLSRAVETARPIAASNGCDLVICDEMIEQDFGAWDGVGFAEAKSRFPDDFAAWWRDAVHHPPSGGENLGSVMARMRAFDERLTREVGPEETVVLVGHGSAFQALLCVFFGIPTRAMWPFRLQNGTLTEVQFKEDQPSLTRMSVT